MPYFIIKRTWRDDIEMVSEFSFSERRQAEQIIASHKDSEKHSQVGRSAFYLFWVDNHFNGALIACKDGEE